MNFFGNPIPVRAKYTPIGLDKYDRNPWASSWGPLFGRMEMGKMLRRDGDYNSSIRQASPQTRSLDLNDLLNVFIPTSTSLDVGENIQNALRLGGLARDPKNPQVEAWRRKSVANLRMLSAKGKLTCDKYATVPADAKPSHGESLSMGLFGLPAAGKTGLVNRIFETLYNDRVLIHEINGETMVEVKYLIQHVPVNASSKQMIIGLVEQLGTLVGEDFKGMMIKHSKKNMEDFILPELVNLLLLYNVGAVIIDEVEMVKAAYSRGDAGLKNLWLFLMNECRVPFILIGNPDAQELFEDEFKLQHRLCGGGCTIFDQLPNEDGGEWQFFMKQLSRYNYTTSEIDLNEAVMNSLYRHSQGLIKVTIRLFMWVQREAIRRGQLGDGKDERITPEVVDAAAKKNAALMEQMISGLAQRVDEKYLTPDLRLGPWRDLAAGQKASGLPSFTQLTDGDKNPETDLKGDGKASAAPKERKKKTGDVVPGLLPEFANKDPNEEETTYDRLEKHGLIRWTTEFV